jgi:hypothetical protein
MKGSLKFAAAAAALTAFGCWLAPAANADKVKNCGTTTETETENVGPGNSGMTQTTTTTTTETQTASCNSNSDTGEVITTDTDSGPVTNRGGGTPGGRQ